MNAAESCLTNQGSHRRLDSRFDRTYLLRYAEKEEKQPVKRSDVLRILQKERNELVDRYNISALSLFGSVARDDAREDSDVDILVEFSRPVSLFQFIELQQRLEGLLGCKVDLGTPRSLKPRIKEQVLKEEIPIT